MKNNITQKNTNMDLVLKVKKLLDDNKANDICEYDISKRNHIADFVIVASCDSNRQIFSLADKVKKEFKKYLPNKNNPLEGMEMANWVVVDLNFAVVHLFLKEVRNYYKIDELLTDKN
jgi:ribosome-associated protein